MATVKSTGYSQAAEGVCWPTRVQELLLRAALLQGSEALDAWRQWKSSIDLDLIDEGSRRLLPLLYHNLHRYGVEDPVLKRYKGNYRLTWYDNQIKFHQLRLVLDRLHCANIQTMILKGAAVTLIHYQDYGLRPMADLDIMIPIENVETATKLLTDSGWIAKWPPPNDLSNIFYYVMHAQTFVNDAAYEVDLHWHLLGGWLSPGPDDDFWDGAIPIQLDGVSTNVLNSTDQLFHVCVHGTALSPVPPIRWVADAIMIMRDSTSEIDWDRLIVNAEKHHLVLSIKNALHYLHATFDAPVPQNVMRHLQSSRISKQEKVVHGVRTGHRNLLGALPLYWYSYLRHAENTNRQPKLKGFLELLMSVWQKDHLWQIPIYIAVKGMKRIWNIVKQVPVKRSLVSNIMRSQ